jgi:RNA polymerase primary sigma factor
MSLTESNTGFEARTRPSGTGSLSELGYQADSDLLARGEEAALIRRARKGDRSALRRLIEANLRLVYKIARRYRCRSYTLDDLVQEGVVGLICAIERFDESKGFRLSTYALHWIRQSIARAVEQNDRMIHVPMQATAEMRRLARLRDDRQRELGRRPSEAELAAETGISEERIIQLLGTVEDALSFETGVGSDQDTSLLELAEDPSAPDPEDQALRDFSREQLRRVVQCLGPRERWVVEERYGLEGRNPQTLDELSRRLRISRERVRQIEVRAIQKLRHALRSSHWD